jgi:hypothetical protein
MEILAFEFLQGQILQFSSSQRLPVVIVDISDIPGGKDSVTPRQDLMDFIEAVVEYKPKAIAIDIDFSPDIYGWKHYEDPDFFDFCLGVCKKTGIPIFLGVHRTKQSSAETWLGLEKYKDLACDMTLPWEAVKVPLASAASGQLPTLGAALANAYMKSKGMDGPPKWLRISLENPLEDTLVNYSKLDQLDQQKIRLEPGEAAKFASVDFADKMIIMGDATLATDHRCIPGRLEPMPGVYVHACTAYTLAIEPLYELNSLSKLCADFAVAMLFILSVAYIRFRHIGEEDHFYWQRLESKWIRRVVILVLVSGILLVRWGGVMWLDFFLVITALLLHSSVERWLRNLWDKKV